MENLTVGGCSTYFVPPGWLTTTENGTNVSLHLNKPGLYFTNCTQEQIAAKITDIELFLTDQNVFGRSTDPYSDGVVAASFIMASITAASWLIFTTHLLSMKRKPIMLAVVALLYSVFSTVTLVRTSNLLDSQFMEMYQDKAELVEVIFMGIHFKVTNFILKIGIWASVLHIVRVSHYRLWQKVLFAILAVSCVVNIVLVGLHFFAYVKPTTSGVIATQMVIYATSTVLVVPRLQFNRKYFAPLPLITTAVCIATVVVFLLFKLTEPLRTWSLMLYELLEILAISLLWEWILEIETQHAELEKRAVVGREITNSAEIAATTSSRKEDVEIYSLS